MHSLKEQITNFDWSLKSIVKAAVAIVVIVIALSIVVSVLSTVAKGVFGMSGRDDYYTMDGSNNYGVVEQVMGGIGGALGIDTVMNTKMAMGRGSTVANDMMMYAESSYMPAPTLGGGPDAEEYERRDYNAHYETRKFEETCAAISGLKPLEYVVFDNSNENDRWCNYNFRAEVEHEEEIITKLQELNPRDFNIDTSTIERSIEYTDSELAMLERRLESTSETLNQAEASFNSLIAQATREGDTATLAEVINNKIATIDRLTQQVLDTQERIDRLTKNRGNQIEQIEYAHFYVSVAKVTYFDGEQFADQWKQRIQQLAADINGTLLALTLGLIAFVLGAVQFVIYGALLVLGLTIFAKVAWVVIRRIWKWEPDMKETNTFGNNSSM